MTTGDLGLAAVTDAPPDLSHDPRVERRFLGLDDMVVVLPAGHPRAGSDPVHIQAPADGTWGEDNDGSAALLGQHAARAGAGARIDLSAAELPGKPAMVATGHAIAPVPGVPTGALRTGVATVPLVDPATRGIYTITPRHDVHPCAPLLHDLLAAAFT